MLSLRSIVCVTALYTALIAGANTVLPSTAHATDFAAASELRTGDMKKLNFHSEPKPSPEVAFSDTEGGSHQLSDLQGDYLVVNFWATWCAPCRHEMPSLSNLQTYLEDKPVQVVTIATGRNSPTGIRKFFDEIGVTNLPEYMDQKQALAREMAVFGLPITVILDPAGNEIARLSGDAEWDSDSAKAIIDAILEAPQG